MAYYGLCLMLSHTKLIHSIKLVCVYALPLDAVSSWCKQDVRANAESTFTEATTEAV